MPVYPWMPPAAVEATPPPPPAPLPTNGRLQLDVEPGDRAQVFVDGLFVGTLADLGYEIDLAPGSHRIEIRAPGYKIVTFEAQIVAARTITYRGALDHEGPPALTAPPAGRTTLYLIPGCYLGNVPPAEVKLPAGCDLARVTTIVP